MGGGCLICLIVLVVKLLTGFEAFGAPVKDFALGVSVVIFDRSYLQITSASLRDSSQYCMVEQANTYMNIDMTR